MSRTKLLVAPLLFALVACQPSTAPSMKPSVMPPSATATSSPTHSARPIASDLPKPFAITGSLSERDNAKKVIAAVDEALGHLPLLKLDVTSTAVTLTGLDRGRVKSLRWSEDVIDSSASDFQYFHQSTFRPEDFPLDRIGRMFDIADLLGVRGELIYQIQQYNNFAIFQTVSSRPESKTIFFRKDASAVPVLGTSSLEDVEEGIRTVLGGSNEVYQLGITMEKNYYAEAMGVGRVERKSKLAGFPVFIAPGTISMNSPTFLASEVNPKAIAQALERYRGKPDDPCAVLLSVNAKVQKPVASFTCKGETHYTDMAGKDITSVLAG